MHDAPQCDQARRTPVERIVGQDLDEQSGKGKPLSSRARQTQRSVESYLKGGARPRWMERVAEIDAGIARERRRIVQIRHAVRREYGHDAEAFAERWREVADGWSFHELNVLIDQHNEWYPIERNLALDPRTGEYVRVAGRSYRRPVLGSAWILDQFPVTAARHGRRARVRESARAVPSGSASSPGESSSEPCWSLPAREHPSS